MHKRKLSAEQKAEIVRLYPEKGESQSSIAKRYGIDETAVQKYTCALFHHPVCCTCVCRGKGKRLNGDCSGGTKGVPVMPPPDRRTVLRLRLPSLRLLCGLMIQAWLEFFCAISISVCFRFRQRHGMLLLTRRSVKLRYFRAMIYKA